MTEQKEALRIRELIIEKFDVQESEITKEANFVKDLGVDSLDMVELLMEVENEFGITIPDEEMEKINTVGELTDYVAEKKK